MANFLYTAAWIASAAIMGSAIAGAQNRETADDLNGMMSNEMMTGFDPDAGLRAAQASNDPDKRVEVLQRPGITELELVVGGRRAQAILSVASLPAGLDPEKWPVTTLIGDYLSPSNNYVLDGIRLRVDGCAIAMPVPSAAGITDPRSLALGKAGGQWTLSISNNGGSEAYTAIYTFDNEKVVAQSVTSGAGSADARWNIEQEDFGEGRDCIKLGKRTAGARAELRAGTQP